MLWAILILAGTLRFWGLDFGMPFIGARPDEGEVAGTAAGLVSAGTLNPHFFAYPSLFLYALSAVYAAVCGAGAAVQAYPTLQGCLEADARLILIGRAVTALAGTAAVAVTYAVGRRLDPRAGLPAALLLAVAFLHVRESHFAVTDVPMTTMLLLAIVLLLRADERPSPGRFAIAGLGAGLAAATKYNAAILAAGAVASQIGAWLDRSATTSYPTRRLMHLRLIVFGAAALAGFLLATPYALLARAEFLRDVRFESWHLMNAHRRIVVDVGWRHHALVTLPLGVGWTLLAAGVAGMVRGPEAAPGGDDLRVPADLLRGCSSWPDGVLSLHGADRLEPILQDYTFRHTIQAVRLSEPQIYDQQDAFYLPIGGFSGVARPGPNLTIYQRRAETPQAPPGLSPR